MISDLNLSLLLLVLELLPSCPAVRVGMLASCPFELLGRLCADMIPVDELRGLVNCVLRADDVVVCCLEMGSRNVAERVT